MVLSPFQNEPFVDFTNPTHRSAMEQALQQVQHHLGQHYPLVIGGELIITDDKLASINPAQPDQVVGYASAASQSQALQAIEVATQRFQSYRFTPAAERIGYLTAMAAEIRRRRFELMAWMVYEVSKTWAEADAEVAEAVDFCEFYAREMERLASPQPNHSLPGEVDEFRYIPLGVGVAISPWNFPFAISTGLVASAIVTGNTVIFKPSPRAPVIGYKIMEVAQAAGVPSDVIQFITGRDADIGDLLVDHPKVRFISFTGSKEIGIRIFERAAKVQPGQKWLKRTILEMGGKDGQIVDETADLDAAAAGIVAGAFGFQGQKCSACSRVIATAPIYHQLLDKVVEKARHLTVGDPRDPEHDLGAVIDDRSLAKIRHYIEIGQQDGRLVLGGTLPEHGGYFVPPTIIADVAPEARLAQEEVFGPVLAFIKAQDFDDALTIANGTDFGLTGGIFSRDPARIQRTREELYVGNLYINRKITGAMVGCHPFGGFNMSGTDSKAGGRDYLLLFLQGQSLAEKQ